MELTVTPDQAKAVLVSELKRDVTALLDASDFESGLDAGERAYCRGAALDAIEQMIDARARLLIDRHPPGPTVRTPEPGRAELENRLYTADEAAVFLRPRLLGHRRVTAATVRRWTRAGRIEAGWRTVPGGRRSQWRISPRSLRQAVERGLPPAGTYQNPSGPDEQTEVYFNGLLG